MWSGHLAAWRMVPTWGLQAVLISLFAGGYYHAIRAPRPRARPHPATRGRRSAQGVRLGEGLLLDALQRALDLSAGLGVHAVQVDAIDDAGAAFYRKYGFASLLDDLLHLYLPIVTVEDLLD